MKTISKTVLKAAARYQARLRTGERIMRDASGRMQWTCGRPVGRKTVGYMLDTGLLHQLDTGLLHQLDTDLFGDRSRGQTLGREELC